MLLCGFHCFTIYLDANIFKEKFNEARDIVKTKCALYNGENEESEDETEYEVISKSDVPEISEVNSSKNEEETEKVAEKLSELDVSNKDSKDEKEA